MTTTVISTTLVDNGDGTGTFTSTTTTDVSQILPGDVTVNSDGSITMDCRLRFLNPFDINTTGVGSITVLPGEALASFLPLLGRGDNGAPATFSGTAILHEVPAGTALPNPSIKVNTIDPGSPNASPPTGPTYQVEMWVHAGPAGAAGTPVNVESLANIVIPAGGLLDGSQISYRSADGQWHVEAIRFVDLAVCTNFSPASGNAPNQVLGSITLAAQGFPRRPWVGGACQINPASDTSNGITHIDLIARLGDANNGVIVGFGQGLDVSTPFIANLWPTPAANSAAALISAGQAANIYLIAQQTNPTLSNWSTTMTHAAFSGLGLAIV